MKKTPRFIIYTLMLLAFCVQFTKGDDKGDGSRATAMLKDGDLRDYGRALLKRVWFNPKFLSKDGKAPVGVILTGKKFNSPDEYLSDKWLGAMIKTFYKQGFSTLVVTCNEGSWRAVTVSQIQTAISAKPDKIKPIDPDRVVLVTDIATGFLGMKIIDQMPASIAGSVFINTPPYVIKAGKASKWTPTAKGWDIPYWVLLGGNPGDCADLMVMWHKLATAKPGTATMTMDQRPEKGLGAVLPSAGIEKWLKSIRAKKKPQEGSNVLLLSEKEKYSEVVYKIQGKIMTSAPTGSGARSQKKEGGVTISVTLPNGWRRVAHTERGYNSVTALSKPFVLNPFVEFHMATVPNSTMLSYVFVAPGQRNAETLLTFCSKRLLCRNYLPLTLDSWNEKGWQFQAKSIIREHKGRWSRWFVLYAVRPVPGNPRNSMMLMIMDKAGKPDAARISSVMHQMIETIAVR